MAKSILMENACPMDVTLNIVSGKWKISILWHLSRGTLRFNELQRRLSPITQKTLTQQLKELELDGMIHRQVYPEVPPRVEYSLTLLGETMKPILSALCQWGKEYQQQKAAPS